MRLSLLLCVLFSTALATNRTSCFQYVDCFERAQVALKDCSGGTAISLVLEGKDKSIIDLIKGRGRLFNKCQDHLIKETIDFDTLQVLVDEDARECFEKLPGKARNPEFELTSCSYTPFAARDHYGKDTQQCVLEYVADREQCEQLLNCCPDHARCGERMNAISVAYQHGKAKSLQIMSNLLQCVVSSDPTTVETVDRLQNQRSSLRNAGLPFYRPDMATEERISRRLALTSQSSLQKRKDRFNMRYYQVRALLSQRNQDFHMEVPVQNGAPTPIPSERRIAIVRNLLRNASDDETAMYVSLMADGNFARLAEMEKEKASRMQNEEQVNGAIEHMKKIKDAIKAALASKEYKTLDFLKTVPMKRDNADIVVERDHGSWEEEKSALSSAIGKAIEEVDRERLIRAKKYVEEMGSQLEDQRKVLLSSSDSFVLSGLSGARTSSKVAAREGRQVHDFETLTSQLHEKEEQEEKEEKEEKGEKEENVEETEAEKSEESEEKKEKKKEKETSEDKKNEQEQEGKIEEEKEHKDESEETPELLIDEQVDEPSMSLPLSESKMVSITQMEHVKHSDEEEKKKEVATEKLVKELLKEMKEEEDTVEKNKKSTETIESEKTEKKESEEKDNKESASHSSEKKESEEVSEKTEETTVESDEEKAETIEKKVVKMVDASVERPKEEKKEQEKEQKNESGENTAKSEKSPEKESSTKESKEKSAEESAEKESSSEESKEKSIEESAKKESNSEESKENADEESAEKKSNEEGAEKESNEESAEKESNIKESKTKSIEESAEKESSNKVDKKIKDEVTEKKKEDSREAEPVRDAEENDKETKKRAVHEEIANKDDEAMIMSELASGKSALVAMAREESRNVASSKNVKKMHTGTKRMMKKIIKEMKNKMEVIKEQLGMAETTTAHPTTVEDDVVLALNEDEQEVETVEGSGEEVEATVEVVLTTAEPEFPKPNVLPQENHCVAYSRCDELVRNYENECERKYSKQRISHGIDDVEILHILKNSSISQHNLVRRACLRPLDKTAHSSLKQLLVIERGVRRACLDLGRNRAILTEEEAAVCSTSVLSTEPLDSFLATNNRRSQNNHLTCLAKLAPFKDNCQAVSRCCASVRACDNYISSSPVRRMKQDAIQTLTLRQSVCEQKMIDTLRYIQEQLATRRRRV